MHEDLTLLRERRDLLKEICALTEQVNSVPIQRRPLLTTKDLAAYWGVSDSAIDAIRETGRLKYYRVGTGKRGLVRFKWEDVQEYMDLYGRPEPVYIGKRRTKAELEAARSQVFRVG